MPNILRIGSYIVFFWSNENEPIHVHISEKRPVENATKIWITKSGGCIVENNNSKIPERQLNIMLEIIEDNFFLICRKWVEHFGKDSLSFYC